MKVVIGVDSGGSTTRALAVTLEGERVGYGESGGGNLLHDKKGRENVREAIVRAADGCGIVSVVRVISGIAGLNRPEDEAWAAEATDVPGLVAARTQVNDSEVAHAGAFAGGPGIVSIQGTGSTVLAVLEDGRRVRNGDFGHYARGGAVWLGMRTVFGLLSDPTAPDDPTLLRDVLALWNVNTREGLREAMIGGNDRVRREWSARYGEVARRTTRSADEDFGFARDLCRAAASDIVDGIRLLGPLFAVDDVPVALIGACVRSAPMRWEVESSLAVATEKRYDVVEPALPPVLGAVWMALKAEGVRLDREAGRRLADSLIH